MRAALQAFLLWTLHHRAGLVALCDPWRHLARFLIFEVVWFRIIVHLKIEITTITLAQVNTLYEHLPVVDIGDDVSRLENCGGGRVGLHSGDPNQQTTWVLSR